MKTILTSADEDKRNQISDTVRKTYCVKHASHEIIETELILLQHIANELLILYIMLAVTSINCPLHVVNKYILIYINM